MYYVVCFMTYEGTISKTFNTYDEAHKEAKKLLSKFEEHDYILLIKVENNEEILMEVF